jgi:hypothetical protein
LFSSWIDAAVRIIVVLIALVVGILSGLGLTWLASASGNGFGAIKIGAWSAWPKSGTVEADPYSRSIFARAGELPLGLADGISFVSGSDDNGASLDGRCDIRIEGRLPPARFWTLTIYDSRGRLIDNAGERWGFNSAEVLWAPNANVDIVLAPRARSGNWIPTAGRDHIVAILRLYDAPVGLGSRSADAIEMPTIRQEFCP